ncbi:MAG: LysM peptidoglycan-binding domain-containing protein [Candidatus Marinimicrobia bacterium]|jgi:membrane-bound lytic murein transglycosylase D|nr:LysM peptidoglycan-binding domain-containing protein [Candidatus Neomarinimicrobiota bacterium]|tara:strand:- start:326 stop:2071 length:1746 start_codon:yes stop_codon:yes gene_type:complete
MTKKYIIVALALFSAAFGQNLSEKPKKPFMNTDDISFLGTSNRITSILDEAKQFLSDAIIADVNLDTVEVVYNIKKVFDLMSDVEQLGVREELDKIEFEKFQTDFVKIYTTRLNTIDSSTQFLTADLIKRDIEEFTSENESVEMGLTKFTIIDDREGHIPLVTNSQVESYIRYFQGKGRKGFNVWLKRYVQYKDIILPILDEYDLPEELIVVSMIEAGLDPKAVSRAQAVGLWQFMYSTGKEYGLNRNWYIDERQDPIKSTHAAAKYFKDLYKEFDDWYLVLAAYNGGWGRLNRALKLHETSDYWQLYSLPQETKNYIPYYLSAAIIVKNPEKYGFKIPRSNPLKYDVVQIEKSADLTVIAKAAGTKLSTIKRLNPELRQPATPNNGPYSLNIPDGKKDIFYKKFSEIPEDRKFAFQKVEHRVQKGENLISIASKYRVLVADLQTINNISNINKLSIGQRLKIPVKGGLYSNYPEKIIYSVKTGDTLGHIAEEFNTRASEIRKWNNMGSKSVIYPGQKLSLFVKGQPVKDSPKKNVYIVKTGDSLGKIAKKNSTTVAKIKSWNSMKSSTIYPGQKLTIYFE